MDLSLMSTSTISSTTHQWPQPQKKISSPDDEKRSLIKAMEIKPGQDPLKCPRCDSCNTKFCYYNNYSLSQPRYFCKGCKRYWTRGGTLRNVPVGGGCRKNKRVRRAAPPSHRGGDGVSATATNPTSKPNVQPEMDLSSTNNPSFYNPRELNFPFSRFNSTRVLDYHHQVNNGVGLGFSSGPENYENGLLDFVRNTNNSSLSSVYNPIMFGSSSGFSVPTSTMGDLQRAGATSEYHEFSGFMGYDEMMQVSGFSENGVKIEGEIGPNSSQINDQINSSDSSSILWNYSTNIGSWLDPNSNLGSSVPSLI